MHELPIIKSIYKSVMNEAESNNAKKIINVYLEVGVLRDFVPSYLKKYWNYISKGSIAEGSNLLIREIPATAKCGQCGNVYPINLEDLCNSICPKCKYDKGELVSGRELLIYGIQVE